MRLNVFFVQVKNKRYRLLCRIKSREFDNEHEQELFSTGDNPIKKRKKCRYSGSLLSR